MKWIPLTVGIISTTAVAASIVYSPIAYPQSVDSDACQNPTISVQSGKIVGGPKDGKKYRGWLTGTNDDDIIAGTPGRDRINGKAGNDIICGGGGKDILRGNEGDDRIYGGTGHDKIYGHKGDDTLYGQEGNDVIWGTDGNDAIHGGIGNDRLGGDTGNDEIFGDAGNDKIWGGKGNDTIRGGEGNDRIGGDQGNDMLSGGPGHDTLHGNKGIDTCSEGEKVKTCEKENTIDTTPPVITLLGDNPLELMIGDVYTDPGATATDDIDGDISEKIVVGGDAVDTDTAGEYRVTYDVADMAGNGAQRVKRAVSVTEGELINPWISDPITVEAFAGTTAYIRASLKASYLDNIEEFNFVLSGFDDGNYRSSLDIYNETSGVLSISIGFDVPKDAVFPIEIGVQLIQDDQPYGVSLPVTVMLSNPSAFVIPDYVPRISDEENVDFETLGGVVKDVVVVHLKHKLDDPDSIAREIAVQYGGVFLGSHQTVSTYYIQIPDSFLQDVPLESVIQSITEDENVEFASYHLYDVQFKPLSPPNENGFDSWFDDPPSGKNWNHEYIESVKAWIISTGIRDERIPISVIDIGFYSNHIDLVNNINTPASANIDDGKFDNPDHGTHVAGIICAEGNNGVGAVGVSWRCNLNLYTNDEMTNDVDLINRAVDEGARVVNISLSAFTKKEVREYRENGELGDLQERADKINKAFANQVISRAKENMKDVLWVFGAGNDGNLDAGLQSPAGVVNEDIAKDNTIVVASIGEDGRISSFSNTGETVTVAAPGEKIYSTITRRCTLFGIICSDQYAFANGTSMAAPHVTGLAALILSQDPTLSAAEVKRRIVDGAKCGGKKVPGHEFYVINAHKSLLLGTDQQHGCGPTAERLTNFSNQNIDITGVALNVDEVVLTANDSTANEFYAVYATKGTEQQPVQFADTHPGDDDRAGSMYSYGGGMFFLAMHDETNQRQLFYPDAISGALPVTLDSQSYPERVNGYIPFSPHLLLVSALVDGIDGVPLCVPFQLSSQVEGTVYRKVIGEHGESLYGYEHEVSNHNKYNKYQTAVMHDNRIHFIASYDVNNDRKVGIWSFDPLHCRNGDGAIIATRVNTPIYENARRPSILLSHNGKLYYNELWIGNSGSNLDSLWVYDGGQSREVHRTANSSGGISSMQAAGDRIFMVYHNKSVYSSRGTEDTLVNDDSLNSPKHLVVIGSDMFVVGGRQGTEGRGPNSLYRSQNAEATFELIGSSDFQMSDLLVYDGQMYFVEEGIGGGIRLSKVLSDGSGFENMAFDGITSIDRAFSVEGGLYIVGRSTEHGTELYRVH